MLTTSEHRSRGDEPASSRPNLGERHSNPNVERLQAERRRLGGLSLGNG